jgi:hypothetical protein
MLLSIFVAFVFQPGFFGFNKYSTYDNYQKDYNDIIKLLRKLHQEYKNQSPDIPQSFRDVIDNIINRIVRDYSLRDKIEGEAKFREMTPDQIFGYLCFDPDEDGNKLLSMFLCSNIYKNCEVRMFLDFVFKQLNDMGILKHHIDDHAIKNLNNINILNDYYDYIKVNRGVIAYSGNERPTTYPTFDTLSLEEIANFIPVKTGIVDKPDFTAMISQFRREQILATDTSCRSECSISDDSSVTMFQEFKNAGAAIKRLQDIKYLDPIPDLQTHVGKIFGTLSIPLVIFFLILFKYIYNKLESVVIVLLVLSIVSGIAYFSSMFTIS